MKKLTLPLPHHHHKLSDEKIQQVQLMSPRSHLDRLRQLRFKRQQALPKINPAKNPPLDIMKPSIMKPSSITKKLDECIVGQEDAKKVLSVAVYLHYKRVFGKRISKSIDLMKSNILLMGGTGVGKIFLVRKISEILNVPFYMADATTITEAGFRGDDVENILTGLLAEAEGDIQKAQSGIVFIDEFDKIAKQDSKYDGHEQSQQALLKMVEGKIADVPESSSCKNSGKVQINTKNILFIFGGAFAGIEEIISACVRGPKRIGFGATSVNNDDDIEGNILAHTTGEDLISFGIIPELIGRIPQLAILHPLAEEHLIHAFASSADSPANQFTELLAMEGVALEFTECGIQAIAAKATKLGVGARGLFAILEQLMTNVMFILPDAEDIGLVVVDAAAVENKSPKLVERERSCSPEFIVGDGDNDKNLMFLSIFSEFFGLRPLVRRKNAT